MVGVFLDDLKTPCCRQFPQLVQLRLDSLVGGRNTAIDLRLVSLWLLTFLFVVEDVFLYSHQESIPEIRLVDPIVQ